MKDIIIILLFSLVVVQNVEVVPANPSCDLFCEVSNVK